MLFNEVTVNSHHELFALSIFFYLPKRIYNNIITIYVKSFEGENFHGFCGFLLTVNALLLKIFLEYQCRPLATQSMIPPGLKFSTTKDFCTC